MSSCGGGEARRFGSRRGHQALLVRIPGVALLVACGGGGPTGSDEPGPPPQIVTAALDDVFVDMPFSEELEAQGLNGQYSWAVAGGSLPAGLALNSATGMISGTPTGHGRSDFTVRLTNGDGQFALGDVAAISLLHPIANCADYPETAITTLEDAVLEAIVRLRLYNRGVLSDQQDDLTCAALAQLEDIDPVFPPDVRSLAGVQNMTGLHDLVLGYGYQFDSGPLTPDPGHIVDLTPLEGLTSLEHLGLWGQSISDIAPLGALTSLQQLELGGNKISDVTVVANLLELRHLDLSYNASLTDIGPLASATKLADLDLSNTPISDITPLSGLTSLSRLLLDSTAVSDLEPLAASSSLRVLSIANSGVSDLSSLSGIATLDYLGISDNQASDLSPLASSTALAHLIAPNNEIEDISPLSALANLDVVDLQGNENLADIAPLGGLDRLWMLNLRGTSVVDLSPLSDFAWLPNLDLRNNSITDVSPLGDVSLSKVWLYDNPLLTDIQPLVDNPWVGLGDELYVDYDNIGCDQIVALRDKRVSVNPDQAPRC